MAAAVVRNLKGFKMIQNLDTIPPKGKGGNIVLPYFSSNT